MAGGNLFSFTVISTLHKLHSIVVGAMNMNRPLFSVLPVSKKEKAQKSLKLLSFFGCGGGI